MYNIKSLNSKITLGFLILFLLTVYSIPIQANIIPLNGLVRAEEILYGNVSDEAILQKIDKLEMALFGQRTKGSLTARAQQIIDYVSTNDSGVSLLLLVNTMEWTLFNEVKIGKLIKRIADLETNIYGEISQDAIITRVERLTSLLVPADVITASNVILSQGEEIHITIQEEISTADIDEGALVNFKIDSNFKVGSHLIIPGGTTGTLQITDIKKAGSFGKNASLTIRINDIMAFDGTMIPLNLKLDDEENSSKEIAIGVSLLSTIIVSNPVGLVAGFFLKGKDVVIPTGTVIKAQVMDDIKVYSIRIQ